MTILVCGANGQLGRELRRIAGAGETGVWIFTDINELPGEQTRLLDICDAGAVESLTDEVRPDVIVNCAAYTDVERAEDCPEAADMLNRAAPALLAEAALKHGATLIHISTDFVFPGNGRTPLRETDAPGPLNVYGQTKLAGEREILESGCKSIIIRTSWLYSPYGRNFVKSILKLAGERPEIEVVSDQTGSPTAAFDLAGFIRSIITEGKLSRTGLYHYCNGGEASRYEFACCIRDLAGSNCRIEPCTSSAFPSKAQRPEYSSLDTDLVKQTFGVRIPHWKDSLRKVIERLSDNA